MKVVRWFGRLIRKIVRGVFALAAIVALFAWLDRLFLGDRDIPRDR